ncbi:uncharacterized protein LOC111863533 [Cryptotermes secundus]|uniref:uncharacterized protein LOC111863533 n=1 Tax=Cryptotermes secundus TaxID=105785 RepID=UPI000CD7D5F3|nr:uncharacterized protein LOC111863533 [Cryptotermes secundus]
MRAEALLILATAALAACSEGDNIPAESSLLAKFVLALSRPGAFNKTHSVFGGQLDPPPEVTSCPLGEEGLTCRQAEARRVIDNCPGGDCEGCDYCHEMHASAWPRCCQHNSLCCLELARACQTCKVATLQTFCNKHFKKCF